MSKKKSRARVARPNPPKSVQARQLRTLHASQFSARVTFGPIPSAEEMARYGQVQSDLPERIMRQFERRTELAEAQSRHRMALERRVISNNIWMERLGWASATGLGVLGLGGSLLLVNSGHSLGGIAGVIGSLAVLLGLYVWGRRDQVQQITKKRAADLVDAGATPQQLDAFDSDN